MARVSRAEYYLPDLAYIHDAGFSEFGARAARGIVRMLKERGMRSGSIVELGCGSGAVTGSLTQHGYTVFAVDSSRAMIRLAGKNCPNVHFSLGSLWEYHIPPCDAVIAVGECLNYEFDGTNTPARLRRLFSRIHDALRPGGLFMFDLLLLPGDRSRGIQKFTRGEDWFVAVSRTEVRGRIVRTLWSFRKHGSLYRQSIEVHHQKRYRLPVVRSLLAGIGFKTLTRPGYGRDALGKDHVVLVAEK